jgi:hypothetical protein
VSASDKPDLARAWRSAMKLVDEEADRLATISDAEFEREMSAQQEPSRVPTTEQLLRANAERKAVRSLPGVQAHERAVIKPSRTRLVAWLAAAAIGLLVIAGIAKRREIIAWWSPHHQRIGPDHWTPEDRLPPLQLAGTLRDEAFAACRASAWARCEDKLNQAKALDPAGEADPRVRSSRRDIDSALHPDAAIQRDIKDNPK